MMKTIFSYFGASAILGVALLCYSKSVIRGSDIVLTILFMFLALIEFGRTWPHRTWTVQAEPAREGVRQLLSRLYVAVTTITVIIPLLSLGGAYLLRVEAPEQIGDSIAGIMTPVSPPNRFSISVITLNGTSLPSGADSGLYVAVFKPAAADISPATPVLQKVFVDIDRQWRSSVTWFIWIAVCGCLVALYFGEMFAGMNIGTGSSGTRG